MAGNGTANGDRKRLLLLVPLACVITAVWVAAGIRAVLTGDAASFVVASAPFGALVGYVLGIRIPSKD